MNSFHFNLNYVVGVEAKDYESALKKAEAKTLGKSFNIISKKISKHNSKTPDIIKIAEFNPEDILSKLDQEGSKEFIIKGKPYKVKINSKHFVFRDNLSCVACGLTGTKLVLEESIGNNSYHFNLYGEENGELVLITKDHITPKKFGGDNNFSNFQTMCSICNHIKDSYLLSVDQISKLREFYNENFSKDNFKEMLNIKISLLTPLRLNKKKKHPEGYSTAVDLNIWRNSEGSLYAEQIYTKPTDSLWVGSIANHSKLEFISKNRYKLTEKDSIYINNQFIQEKK